MAKRRPNKYISYGSEAYAWEQRVVELPRKPSEAEVRQLYTEYQPEWVTPKYGALTAWGIACGVYKLAMLLGEHFEVAIESLETALLHPDFEASGGIRAQILLFRAVLIAKSRSIDEAFEELDKLREWAPRAYRIHLETWKQQLLIESCVSEFGDPDPPSFQNF